MMGSDDRDDPQVNQLDLLPPIPANTNFALFLCSLVFAMFWVTSIYSHCFTTSIGGPPMEASLHTWEVTPGNKPPKIPQNSHLNGV